MQAALRFVLALALFLGAAQQPSSAEFLTLSNAWKGALRDYSVELLRYDRVNAGRPPDKREPKDPPLHPASAWWQRFERLAAAGDADALEWQVEQSLPAFPAAEQRTAAAEKALRELLRTQPEGHALEQGLVALRPLYESFGHERFVALLRVAHEQARGAENQARALELQAWAISDHGEASPERKRELQQLYDEILLVHPGTRAAREVAGRVSSALEVEFLSAELTWIDDVRKLQLQGEPPEKWPRQPMHAWNDKYLPVAAAGGAQARQFVDQVFPGYQQAEGNGIGQALAWLQRWWMLYAPPGSADWIRARLGVIEIAARQFHGQPLVTNALVDLAQYGGALPLAQLEPALAPVFADDSDKKAQALAHFTRAYARSWQNQWADWQAARAELELLLEKYPTQEIVARARELLAGFASVWPGSPAPDFRGSDQEGHAFKLTDYAGSVCVLDFGSQTSEFGPPEIARRRELIRAFAGRPLRWIGGILDTGTLRTFRESLGAAGVDWRCALLGSRDGDVARAWSLQALPAVFVVDAQGVIRARNLPWDEQRALIESLVSAAEQKQKPR